MTFNAVLISIHSVPCRQPDSTGLLYSICSSDFIVFQQTKQLRRAPERPGWRLQAVQSALCQLAAWPWPGRWQPRTRFAEMEWLTSAPSAAPFSGAAPRLCPPAARPGGPRLRRARAVARWARNGPRLRRCCPAALLPALHYTRGRSHRLILISST